MNSHERFKRKFLLRLNRLGQDGWHVRPSLLAFDYGIPEAQVRKMLVQWAEEGLIWLGADDGATVRPWNEWDSPDEMFSAPVDAGQIRIRMLPPGAEYCADVPKSATAAAN
jgi:hypothetical protein